MKKTCERSLPSSEPRPPGRTQRGASMWMVLLLVAPLLLVTAKASPTVDQIIYPTGVFPTDVQNVQAALDAGGTILLKATDPAGVPTAFNFGPAVAGLGRVFIRRDVVLQGETLGSNITTIRGGNAPIRGFVPVRSAIRGIHFDGPRVSAVLIFASAGTEIVGNKITNVHGFPSFPGQRKAVGIWLAAFVPEDISGTVLIQDNVIQDLDAEIGDGIALVILAADTRLVGNEIRGVNTSGVLVSGSTHPVWIEGNLIAPGPELFPSGSLGEGITVDNIFQVEPQAPVYISHNTVICDNQLADGITLAQIEGPVVTQNHVIMHDVFFGGISVFDQVSNAYVGQNSVEGAGAYALGIEFLGFAAPVDRFNSFVGNNIVSFRSTLADVFLDATAEKTVLVGNSGTVIDLGSNNRITGFTQLGPGSALGQQIREASQGKRALLQALHSVNWPDDLSK